MSIRTLTIVTNDDDNTATLLLATKRHSYQVEAGQVSNLYVSLTDVLTRIVAASDTDS